MSKARAVIRVFIAFAAGSAVGGVAVFYFLSSMYAGFSTTTAAAGVTTKTVVLNLMRKGDVPAATEMLEGYLDSDLMTLSAVRGEDLSTRDLNAIRRAQEYRLKFPRATKQVEVDAAVSRALSARSGEGKE